MPAPGGAERAVGNNPIAIAVPAAGEIPIVLDMATSEAAMGKIRMAERARQPIPPTWAVTARRSRPPPIRKGHRRHAIAFGGREGFRPCLS